MTMTPEPKRILVVDDRASDSRLVRLYLERDNEYVVREVNDANAALSAALAFEPNLILLDLMMPGIGGTELAGLLEASPKLKGVPIVFLTAAITKEQVQAVGGRIGKFPFLAKPIVLTEVAARLKQILGG
jgi:Response regulators consisting of a CheY-like receiver domain and a winged-helix DNA-binding domain